MFDPVKNEILIAGFRDAIRPPNQEELELMRVLTGAAPIFFETPDPSEVPETVDSLQSLPGIGRYTAGAIVSFAYDRPAPIVEANTLRLYSRLLGMDADPARRNIFGVIEKHPDLARDGVRLRQIGQMIIEILGGKRIHPAWVVPGGVNEPLTAQKRDKILEAIGRDRPITAGFVVHLEHAQGAALHHHTGHQGEGGNHQHIHRVTIVSQGLRDVAVVAGVVHRRTHETVNEHRAGLMVDFVLDRIRIGRNLDDDIEGIGRLGARGDLQQAHDCDQACWNSGRASVGHADHFRRKTCRKDVHEFFVAAHKKHLHSFNRCLYLHPCCSATKQFEPLAQRPTSSLDTEN